ncbi:MAG: FkbM family methyltransferase [Ignavibacteria bacterium]|nr:FkbM family methyltransferase [Ignavibacteria bacterium]
MNKANRNWLSSLNRRIKFYRQSNKKRRIETEYPWTLFEGKSNKAVELFKGQVKGIIHKLGFQTKQEISSSNWLNNNAASLWEARTLFNDDLSKLLFDETLVLRSVGHRRFYFPVTDFSNIIEILDENPFINSELPDNILGLPLKLFDLRLPEYPDAEPIEMVTCKEDLSLLNDFRQYFIKRNSIEISPSEGDVVLDCGACIGDISLLFAGLVGKKGEVHLFDPVPLHARFCRFQASLNPVLTEVFKINELAVTDRTYVNVGNKSDSGTIEPGGLAVDSFSATSLDDYAKSNLKRVDFIKMDIEGFEQRAIDGASNIIKEFKPRLAISAYHNKEDIWQIPIKLKSLNPDYELFFGHHSPTIFESVVYAAQR